MTCSILLPSWDRAILELRSQWPIQRKKRSSSMSNHHPVFAAVVFCVFAPLLQAAAPELGVIYGDDVYVNCEYRIAAQFPGEPMFRDITYRDGARSAPARQFYVERGKDLLSVTVAHFANGPDQDQSLVDGAVAALHRRGEV